MKQIIEHAYIHLPFCKRKCRYCSFVSGFDLSLKTEYLSALKKEIRNRYCGEKLKTLYIGGGTPSLLEGDEISEIVSLCDISAAEEITLEANPESVSYDKFVEYGKAGVNRISLGVQTFDDKIAEYIGRSHKKDDVYKATDIIKSSGFDNISIDLIYGLPGQNTDNLLIDLNEAIKIGIKHVSAYGLKIEKGCYFYNREIDNLPDDEEQAKMYNLICEFLKKHGFEHYEISNFSMPGYESKHNTAYWKNRNYYGFGLNASGYEGRIRYTNECNMRKYIDNPGSRSFEETLSETQILEEDIILALRLSEGVDISKINKKFGIDFLGKYEKIVEKYLKSGLLSVEGDFCRLTESGFLLSNEVMSDFIEQY